MLGLAIDSANRTASAALWQRDAHPGSRVDGRSSADSRPNVNFDAPTLLAFEVLSPEMGKADQLISVIERLLEGQGLTYQDLGLIAVNRGPGSFTGIRSGVALTRGLALAAELPVLGVTSHEALASALDRAALNQDGERSSMIALDARRGEVYAQAFAPDGAARGEIEAKAPARVAAEMKSGCWRLAGSGAELVAEQLADGVDVVLSETPPIDARMVMQATAAKLAAGVVPTSGFECRPLYIRAPDAVPPKPLVTPASQVDGQVSGAAKTTVGSGART